MAVLFTNNATSTLASGISSGATSITLATGAGSLFPNPSSPDYFYVTLADSSNNIEIVKCTARSGDVLTVTRAQEGTTARVYSTGDKVGHRITAAALANKLDKDTGGTIAGNLGVSGNFSVDGNTTLGNAGADVVTHNASSVLAPNGISYTGGTFNFSALQVSGVNVVDLSSAQTLTNKTLTAPIITTISNSGTITIPTGADTLVGRATTDTLTNKTITGLAVSSTVNDNSSGSYPIGYKDIPQHGGAAFTASFSLALEDRGKHSYFTGSSAAAVTIPPQGTVAWLDGSAHTVVCNGTGTLTIAPGSGVTLIWAGTGGTGTRTLARYGIATILRVASDTWIISGTNLS